MSEELINQITLNCLMNKQQYERNSNIIGIGKLSLWKLFE